MSDSRGKEDLAAGVKAEVLRISPEGKPEKESRLLAAENPVALSFNRAVDYGVMMVTPCDLEDFALGFCLGEGIIRSGAEFESVRFSAAAPEDSALGIPAVLRLEIELGKPAFHRLLQRQRRAVSVGSACGVCGVDDLENLPAPSLCMRRERGAWLKISAVRRAVLELPSFQRLNRKIRMLHAAAFADETGAIRLIREDIGRHNALDKLVGAMAAQGVDAGQGFCLLTSRCSFEMASKAIAAGFGALAAVSAPSAYAVALARKAGMPLVALFRRDGERVFSGVDQLDFASEAEGCV